MHKNNNRGIIRITEFDLHNIIKESVSSILKESFNHWQSPKLAEIMKQHGVGNGSLSDHYFLTQLQDENVEGVSQDYIEGHGKYSYKLGDGTYLVFNTNDNKIAQRYCGGWCGPFEKDATEAMRPNNEFARYRASGNHLSDNFYSREHYRPSTRRGKDARDLRNNPYFRKEKNNQYGNESSWNRNTANKAMNNLRTGKDQFGNDNTRI